MGLRISTNLVSLNAQNSLAKSQRVIEKSFAQISSGSRITKSSDDAAGLSISEQMKSQIRSMRQANRNASDGISLLQVAEGGLNETSNIITRLRELAIQASSDTISDVERGMLNREVNQLTEEVERIAQSVKFGNTHLLNGTAEAFDFHVGSGSDDFADRLTFDPSNLNSTADNLGLIGIDYSTKEGAKNSLSTLDNAQVTVNGFRAEIGAVQNRMYSTVSNLDTMTENLSAANSRIRDADLAMSTSELATNQILLNASTGILAQANQQPATALKLLG